MDAVVTALLHTLEDPEKKQDTWTPAEAFLKLTKFVFSLGTGQIRAIQPVRAWWGSLEKLTDQIQLVGGDPKQCKN